MIDKKRTEVSETLRHLAALDRALTKAVQNCLGEGDKKMVIEFAQVRLEQLKAKYEGK